MHAWEACAPRHAPLGVLLCALSRAQTPGTLVSADCSIYLFLVPTNFSFLEKKFADKIRMFEHILFVFVDN